MRLEVFAEQLQVELDGRERVLDLVGEAAGEGSELGEAFGVLGALLEPSEVTEDEDGRDRGDRDRRQPACEQSPNEAHRADVIQ